MAAQLYSKTELKFMAVASDVLTAGEELLFDPPVV